MKVKIDQKVQKQILKLRDESLKSSFLDFIEKLIQTPSLSDIAWIKPLTWYTNYFRYRVWDYRVWFVKKDDCIFIEKFMHRKDIYKKYP